MIYQSSEDIIANNYFKHLNGTLAFIVLGIYFSIIELDHFQNYAIFSSLLITFYLIFNFKEYDRIAQNYIKRYRGIRQIIPFCRNLIFMTSMTLLISAAVGLKLFNSF